MVSIKMREMRKGLDRSGIKEVIAQLISPSYINKISTMVTNVVQMVNSHDIHRN
jgi:hypothetical protein